ncbi:NAD-dependent epimerase/dehydratase family protein [Candidatus Nitrospira bockiana]
MQALAGQRVFLTGGSGFIGAHLLRRLTDVGAEVHVPSRRVGPQNHPGVSWYRADVSDLHAVRRVMERIKPDLIFHLASHVVGARSIDAVMPTFQSNLMTTVNLLTVASQLGCRRFILVGSQEEPAGMSADAIPSSPYAAAKWASAAYARMFHQLYRLPIVTLRLFMVYGPGQADTQKLIPYVIRSLLTGDAPKLMSGGRLIDWVYVDDVVEALYRAAGAPQVEGQTFDIGSGELVAVRNIVERVVHLMNGDTAPVFGAIADRPFEQVRAAERGPAEERLGWRPLVGLEEGLKRTIDWYRQRSVRERV